jgi:predicted O-methyltransferase YrrM
MSSFISRLLINRPNVDRALCRVFKKDRLELPEILPGSVFPFFEDAAVKVQELPRGPWSTPLRDVLVLLKILVCSRPTTLLEVGSYRGYTALLMAKHMRTDATLVTVDQDSRHGEAYRGTELADNIERRVGTTGHGVLGDPAESYDFIFLDAGHKYHEVKHDTELLLPLLTQDGFILWHDYANWGFFNGINGVPEYLHELAQDRPVAQVSGTGMAMHSPAWSTHRREAFEAALLTESAGPWTTSKLRG